MDLQLLENRRYTNLFGKSIVRCKNVTSMHNIFCFIKITVGIVLLVLSGIYRCGWENVNTWLTIVVVQSSVAFCNYFKLIDMLKKPSIILNVAEELHQVIYIGQDQHVEDMQDVSSFLANPLDDPTIELTQNEENKKKSLLANQIRWEVTNLNPPLRYIGHLAFLLNQGLLIWGFIIEFQGQYWIQGDKCSNFMQVYLCLFLFFTFFQYLEVYILTLFILICIPFFLTYLIYIKIKGSKKKINSQKIIEELKQKGLIKFKPDIIPGDPECKICMQTYQINDNIIKLPCHDTHNFHDYCVTTWFKVNLSCPVCRKSYYQEDEGMNLENVEA